MFCPRCGRNLSGDEYVCPECGNVLREAETVERRSVESSPDSLVWVFFIAGLVAMFLLTYFVGFYFLFLFIPVFITGTRRGRTTMLFTGAMIGTFIALVLKMLL